MGGRKTIFCRDLKIFYAVTPVNLIDNIYYYITLDRQSSSH